MMIRIHTARIRRLSHNFRPCFSLAYNAEQLFVVILSSNCVHKGQIVWRVTLALGRMVYNDIHWVRIVRITEFARGGIV